MSKYTSTCSQVERFYKSPANLEHPVRVSTECYSCGRTVCTKCSCRRKYYNYGMKRLCIGCQISYDGNEDFVNKRFFIPYINGELI